MQLKRRNLYGAFKQMKCTPPEVFSHVFSHTSVFTKQKSRNHPLTIKGRKQQIFRGTTLVDALSHPLYPASAAPLQSLCSESGPIDNGRESRPSLRITFRSVGRSGVRLQTHRHHLSPTGGSLKLV